MMKTYIDSKGNKLIKCPKCGVYLDKLTDEHPCKEFNKSIKIINEVFGNNKIKNLFN